MLGLDSASGEFKRDIPMSGRGCGVMESDDCEKFLCGNGGGEM